GATCTFRYYTLRSFPIIGTLFDYLGLSSPTTINITLQAVAPHGASTFRKTAEASDFSISPATNVTSASFTQLPNASDGSARLTLLLQIQDTDLCEDTPSASIVCNALGLLSDVCIPVLGSGLCNLGRKSV